jgi:hypothetical protein
MDIVSQIMAYEEGELDDDEHGRPSYMSFDAYKLCNTFGRGRR